MTIHAKIIADSVSVHGQRITTWELVYPRFIHSELMTHRVFSRNAASSRAIPIDKMMEMVSDEPAMPIHWGLNQSGMQAKAEHKVPSVCQYSWEYAARAAVRQAQALQSLGLHKQIVNRVLEPFQWMKTVVTATEYKNWYHLRDHKDAQPEIARLAELMSSEVERSEPQELQIGEWHLPYINCKRNPVLGMMYLVPFENDEWELTLEEALKVSSSCCAQVSYRLLDQSVEKAIKIYDQLVNMRPVHASPFEHQAKVMNRDNANRAGHSGAVLHWEQGITHMDKRHDLWSGNFKGFIQHRQLIKDNVVEG